MMDISMVEYAPYILITIQTLVLLNIFARTSDLKALEAKIMTTLAQNYVSKDTYTDNHKALQEQMLQIHNDISDIKNLLISRGK